jgi:hypothetical protein
MALSAEEMRNIYRSTVIVRRPTHGIVKGYHELPYVCLGASSEVGFETTRVKGVVQVSPQFLIRPDHYAANYEDIFGEDHVDGVLAGRVFGFLGFPRKPVECKSERLELKHLDASVDEVLSESLEELERYEDITTGVIITPNSQYFPVSIERFISSVIEDEFSM